jgi:DNA-nicking Smr family endonuclease
MKRLKSLKDIQELKIGPREKKRSSPKAEARAPEPAPAPSVSDDGGDIFHQAMDGVEPLKDSGRRVPPAVQEPVVPAQIGADEMKALRDLVDGKIEFAVEFTDEFLQAHVLGMDSRIFRKLRAGAYSCEAHLDLHGLNSEQAYFALADFIRSSYLNEKRCVLVVTGRGRNSPDGQPVIKQEVQRWLTKDPLKRVVLAFCTALPRDGGAGAMYILLRKSRKSHGKIVWDRLPLDRE